MAATSRGLRRLSGTHGQAAQFIFLIFCNISLMNIGNSFRLRYNNKVKVL
ncbi:hypothetical protein SpAn4DRAFT_3358 [Sporomusa ovata]|uniref:Uncharacterized protein n=1 Tax=Sporomusa ovata TaxID=2378 RepID=A0A0U1KZP7_9FIRM|nr:hypothetical protein SpAn4DRAFT_3358 [Sporomusa ovata]